VVNFKITWVTLLLVCLALLNFDFLKEFYFILFLN
jgi:hypothetical protein